MDSRYNNHLYSRIKILPNLDIILRESWICDVIDLCNETSKLQNCEKTNFQEDYILSTDDFAVLLRDEAKNLTFIVISTSFSFME